jgi:Ca2+-binding RTX toxin-like protein
VSDDALQVTTGSNVLDGGAGSNFLFGGDGADGGFDTFFLDGRGGAVTWSTIVNFHPGDQATIFGFHPGVSTRPYTASDGVGDYRGLTIHSELSGQGTGINASLTFAGIDQSTADAHFTFTTGTLAPDTPNATDYMLIQYNR